MRADILNWGNYFISRQIPLLRQNSDISAQTLCAFWSAYEPESGKNVDVYLSEISKSAAVLEMVSPKARLHEFNKDFLLSETNPKHNRIVVLKFLEEPSTDFQNFINQLSSSTNTLIIFETDKNPSEVNFLDKDQKATLFAGPILIDSETSPIENCDLYAPADSENLHLAAGFTAAIAAAAWSKDSNLTALDIKNYLLESSEVINSQRYIVRKIEKFEPLWSTTEFGIVDTFKPRQKVLRHLRCKNPAKGLLTFKIIDGFLPDGLQLSDDGIISGVIQLQPQAKPDHLNYFSAIIRATNSVGYVDRNISFVVTENISTIRHDNNIIASVQLAKCDGGTSNDQYFALDDGAAFNGFDVYPVYPHCCFAATSLVRLHNGEEKKISEITTADFVLQYDPFTKETRSARILGVIALPLEANRQVYQINDLPIYVTSEHPLYGSDGKIYAVAPALAEKQLNIYVESLVPGVYLNSDFGAIKVSTLRPVKTSAHEKLYHLFVDGCGSYYVGHILTHKKHTGVMSLETNLFSGAINE